MAALGKLVSSAADVQPHGDARSTTLPPLEAALGAMQRDNAQGHAT